VCVTKTFEKMRVHIPEGLSAILFGEGTNNQDYSQPIPVK
jgi:hypothetical protein